MSQDERVPYRPVRQRCGGKNPKYTVVLKVWMRVVPLGRLGRYQTVGWFFWDANVRGAVCASPFPALRPVQLNADNAFSGAGVQQLMQPHA